MHIKLRNKAQPDTLGYLPELGPRTYLSAVMSPEGRSLETIDLVSPEVSTKFD